MTPSSVGRLWRWGVPATATLAALAAASAVAGWLWGPVRPSLLRDLAITAAAFSATLLACRTIAGPGVPSALPTALPTDRRTEAFLAASAIAAGVVLAALQLDGLYAIDEITTLGHYVVNRPLAAVRSYGMQNNHVLHTLLVWVAHQLGGLNRVVLRLPAFLSFCLLLPVLWWFVRREYGSLAALFATALVSTSSFFLAYATAARGYTLLLLFFAAALLCGQALVRNPKRKWLWPTWAVVFALGFYTIPLFVFPGATTVVWVLLARWRRFGHDGLVAFAAQTAAWLAVAVAVAGALYLPVGATTGFDNAWAVLSRHRHGMFDVQLQRLAKQPVAVWYHWHVGVPVWVPGVLLALAFFGAAVAARTCGRRGTLLLATGLATGMLLPLHYLLLARMMIWALLVQMILAGTGAAFVLERAVARASARWPGIAAARRRSVWQWGALALVLGASSWWATTPGVRIATFHPSAKCSRPAQWWCGEYKTRRQVPMATLALAQRMQPGDYFTACRRDGRIVLDIGAVAAVAQDVGRYSLSTNPAISWTVHRVSPRAREVTSGRQRLFVFESLEPIFFFPNGQFSNCRAEDLPPALLKTLLETSSPDHELVVAFDKGRVYAVNNWIENPSPNTVPPTPARR